MPTNDKRASEDVLAELHGTVARTLKARLLADDASAADINAAIKFLKDNNINCDGAQNKDLVDIAAGLPTYDDEDGVTLMN